MPRRSAAPGVPPSGDEAATPDEATPLDEPDDPPVPLASIPLAPAPDLDDESQTFDVTSPGELYRDGETNPAVGEGGDDLPEGTYRPG